MEQIPEENPKNPFVSPHIALAKSLKRTSKETPNNNWAAEYAHRLEDLLFNKKYFSFRKKELEIEQTKEYKQERADLIGLFTKLQEQITEIEKYIEKANRITKIQGEIINGYSVDEESDEVEETEIMLLQRTPKNEASEEEVQALLTESQELDREYDELIHAFFDGYKEEAKRYTSIKGAPLSPNN